MWTNKHKARSMTSWLVCLAMIISMVPGFSITAYADPQPIAAIERKDEMEPMVFASFQDALDAVQSGDTLILMQDVTIANGETATLNRETDYFTLDLAGHELTVAGTLTGGVVDEAYPQYSPTISVESSEIGVINIRGVFDASLCPWTDDYYNIDEGAILSKFIGADAGIINIRGGEISGGMMINNGGEGDLRVTISGGARLSNLGDSRFYPYSPGFSDYEIHLTIAGGYYDEDPRLFYMTESDGELYDCWVQYPHGTELVNNHYPYYVETAEGVFTETPASEITQQQIDLGIVYNMFHDFVEIDEAMIQTYEGQADWTADPEVYRYRVLGHVEEHNHAASSDWFTDEAGHWHSCNICGQRMEYENHDFVGGNIIAQPTHDERGIQVMTCAVCNYTCEMEIPPIGHNWATEWSYNEVTHFHLCTDGDGAFMDCADHTFGQSTIITEPTCEQPGEKMAICTVCGYEVHGEIPAIGHDFKTVEWGHNETQHWIICQNGCGFTARKADHSFDAPVVVREATHLKAGEATQTCGICGYVKTITLPKGEHTWYSEYSSDDYHHWRFCEAGDGAIDKKELHIWDDGTVTKAATCSEWGEIEYTCTVCGHKVTDFLQKLDHTYNAEHPTYTHDADRHYAVCDVCEDVIYEEDHNWNEGEELLTATETTTGTIRYTCILCGETKDETIPVTSHVHTPSALWDHDQSWHWHTCTSCGMMLDRASHNTENMEHDVYDAVCIWNGFDAVCCSICGEEIITTIPATGVHTIDKTEWFYNEGAHWHFCSGCMDVRDDVEEHTFGAWADDIMIANNQTRSCTVCGYVETRIKEIAPETLAAMTSTEPDAAGNTVINLSSLSEETVPPKTVALPSNIFTTIEDNVSNDNNVEGAKFNLDEKTSVTYDADALKAIADQIYYQAVKSVSLTLAPIESPNTDTNQNMSDEQKQAVASENHALVFEIKLELTTDLDEVVEMSNFGGGGVTVTVPYTKPEGTSNVKVWRVEDDGTKTEMSGVVLDETTGSITWTTPSHSFYMVTAEDPVPPTYSYSGDSSTTSYSITMPSAKNGSVIISQRYADAGSKVTLTVTPKTGYMLGYVTVSDKSGALVELEYVSEGKYTFIMPASKLKVDVEFIPVDATPAYTAVFTDVPSDSYYADAVAWAVEKEITTGTDDNTFSPKASCTREQLLTFIWRAMGSPEPMGDSSFADVASGSYYEKAVRWGIEYGVTTGIGGNAFGVGNTCTREQAVTFLYRALHGIAGDTLPFTDVASDSYARDAISWAVKAGITNGVSNTSFDPTSDCIRAQIVTFLYRAFAA